MEDEELSDEGMDYDEDVPDLQTPDGKGGWEVYEGDEAHPQQRTPEPEEAVEDNAGTWRVGDYADQFSQRDGGGAIYVYRIPDAAKTD